MPPHEAAARSPKPAFDGDPDFAIVEVADFCHRSLNCPVARASFRTSNWHANGWRPRDRGGYNAPWAGRMVECRSAHRAGLTRIGNDVNREVSHVGWTIKAIDRGAPRAALPISIA